MSLEDLQIVWDFSPFAVPAFLWLGYVCWVVLRTGQKKSFDDVRAALRHNRLRRGYVYLLDRLLEFFDWAMGDAKQLAQREGQGWGPFGRNAWTARSYDRCLLLALFYPVLGCIVMWVALGTSGQLDDWVLISGVERWQLALRIGLLVSLAFAFRKAMAPHKHGTQHRWFVLSLVLPLVLILAFTGTGTGTGGGGGGVAVFVALAFTFLGALAFTSLGAFASAATVAAAVVVAVAVTVAVDRAFTGASIVAVTGAVAVAFTVVGAFTLAGAFALARVVSYLNSNGWLWLFNIGFWVAAVLVSLGLPSTLLGPLTTTISALLVFGAIVPLANAPVDWLSTGATRSLLYAIRDERYSPAFWALRTVLDLVLAAFFIVLVAVTTTATLALFNRMLVVGGAAPLLDVSALLAGISTDPGNRDYYWVYLTLLTTLIPTVLHVFVTGLALVGYVGQVFATWRRKAAEDLADDSRQQFKAIVYFTLVPVAALGLACVMVWIILKGLSHPVFIEWLTGWLGTVASFVQGPV